MPTHLKKLYGNTRNVHCLPELNKFSIVASNIIYGIQKHILKLKTTITLRKDILTN